MVKIKTSPNTSDKKKKGLNENIQALTKALVDVKKSLSSQEELKSTEEKRTREKNSNLAKEIAKEVWGGDLRNQTHFTGSAVAGGLLGISPALIKKLNIDKAVGAILESTFSGIKKKWTQTSSSSSSKINSALEANKNTPTIKRLDTIIGLLKTSKKQDVIAEKKTNSIFGHVLSFLGSLALPLLKIGATLGLIYLGIKALCGHFKINLGNTPTQRINNINTIKDIPIAVLNEAKQVKGAMLTKLSEAEKAQAIKSATKAETLLAKAELDTAKAKRADNLINKAKAVEDTTHIKQLEKIRDAAKAEALKKETQALKATTKSLNYTDKAINSANAAKGGGKFKGFGGFLLGTLIDAAATGIEVSTSDDKLENSIAIKNLKEGVVVNGIATTVGGVLLPILTKGGIDPVKARELSYLVSDFALMGPRRAYNKYAGYKAEGRELIKPEGTTLNPFEDSANWAYYSYDQLSRGKTPDVATQLKKDWKEVIEPNKEWGWWVPDFIKGELPGQALNDTGYFISDLFDAITKSIGVGAGYEMAANDKGMSYINPAMTAGTIFKTWINGKSGLATDFDNPILAADQTNNNTAEIAENTASTRNQLQQIIDILNTIVEGRDFNPFMSRLPNNFYDEGNMAEQSPTGITDNFQIPELNFIYNRGRASIKKF